MFRFHLGGLIFFFGFTAGLKILKNYMNFVVCNDFFLLLGLGIGNVSQIPFSVTLRVSACGFVNKKNKIWVSKSKATKSESFNRFLNLCGVMISRDFVERSL